MNLPVLEFAPGATFHHTGEVHWKHNCPVVLVQPIDDATPSQYLPSEVIGDASSQLVLITSISHSKPEDHVPIMLEQASIIIPTDTCNA